MRTTVRSPATPGSWLAKLRDSDDAWLMSLLSCRPDLMLSEPGDLADIADRMVTTASAKVFYEIADQTARHVLEALCVLPSPVPGPVLAEALGVSPQALEPPVSYLAAAGMALVEADGRIVANPGLAGAIDHPCRLGPAAADLLGSVTVSDLATLAGRLGVATKGAKAAMIADIAGGLGDARRLRHLLQSAPPGTDDLIRLVAHEWPLVQLNYGVANMIRQDHTAPGWCLQRGLLIGTGWAGAVMPREAAMALRGGRLIPAFCPEPPALVSAAPDGDRADRQGTDAALEAVADVAAICEAWSAAPPKLLQAGGLGIREIRRVAKLVARPEDTTARLVELAGAAGLIGIEGDLVLPTALYDRWRAQSAVLRWRDLASTWLHLPAHLSVVGAMGADDKVIPALLGPRPEPQALARRVQVMQVLSSAPPGAPLDPEAVAARLVWASPALWQGGPARPPLLISWLLGEAELLGMAGGGALSSFGRSLVEGDKKAAERQLTALAPPVVAEVTLQADLTAVVAGEPLAELRAELDLLADVESSGHATVWRFSETSLRRAFDAGRTSEAILALFTTHAPKGIPQPLAYLVEDLGRRFGQIRVGAAGCYVRSDDPSLLTELVRAKKTARVHLRILAPTVAVTNATPRAVMTALREGGYLAAGEETDGTLTVSRPVAHRAGPASIRPQTGLLGMLGFDEDEDEDEDEDDYDDDDYVGGYGEDELLAELLGDPETLAAVTGLPAAMATALLASATGAGDVPGSAEGLQALVERLRHAPAKAPAAPAPLGPKGRPPTPRPLSPPQLFDGDSRRPTHIAKDPAAVKALLRQAFTEGWPVRMAYVNSRGDESEFFAEVLVAGQHTLRVRYLGGKSGGSELTWTRVRWTRVVTEAEEELVLG